MMNLEILGFAGGVLVTISLLPQVIKCWRTKSTKDISITYTIILIIGLMLWVLYAVLNSIVPLVIFASIELLITIALLVLKLIYK